jgi:phosphoribosylamine--glycine ligase
MKILVVGGGGREHALVWKIAQSQAAGEIIAAPGNAGIAGLARCVAVGAEDVGGLLRLVEEEDVDLVVIGPEAPLALGLADRLIERGVTTFGPSMAGARIEGSKSFAKDVMRRAGVCTAGAVTTGSREDAIAAADELGYPVVIKADGLAAGKGVVVAIDAGEAVAAVEDALVRETFGPSGRRLLIEEYLEGEEASILAFVDGERSALLAPSQDHKRAYDGDRGPNTGGMGAYAPAPVITAAMLDSIRREIIDPTVAALRELDGTIYRGVLYAGLMITPDGPSVIEFNCRFAGDAAASRRRHRRGDVGHCARRARPRLGADGQQCRGGSRDGIGRLPRLVREGEAHRRAGRGRTPRRRHRVPRGNGGERRLGRHCRGQGPLCDRC